MADDFEQAEYFALVGAVDDFDQRLITVKGWGVSLSLVALGFGFQYSAYGFFLIAAVSSLAFWLIEGAIKQFQMRHYVRIREIEVNRYSAAPETERTASSPRIDWSWDRAHNVLRGKAVMGANVQVLPRGSNPFYRWAWWLPQVALPHLITFLVATALFISGINNHLHGFFLGSHCK